MKIELNNNKNIDANIYLKRQKDYTEVIIFGFFDFVPQGDSFKLMMSPRRIKKHLFQYIYQHSVNDYIRKSLLGKF